MRRTSVVAWCVASLALFGCGEDGSETVSPYDRAPVPAVPDRTATVPIDGQLPDGSYWATVVGADDGTIRLLVTQAFFAAACTEQFGEAGCDGDIGVLEVPSREIEVSTSTIEEVTVVDAERRNYAVPPQEWSALASGAAPSADAPDGFAYRQFPYLVSVVGGEVRVARQIWLP